DIEYAGDTPAGDLDTRIATLVAKLLAEGHRGDMLVFLPGVGEIRRSLDAIVRKVSPDVLVVPLYADLSKQEQEIAVQPNAKQKIVLSTNVAETSVTIAGITAVIDSGLARIASHNWWSGLPVLRMGKISQASATQRAGRAGRTAPGRCLRLYSSADFSGRPSYETPEVQRMDMAQSWLELKAMGVDESAAFPWYEAPPASSLKAAENLLYRLGATDESGVLLPLGKQMAAIPAHPRMARLVLEAAKRGIPYEGATLAAWLGERAAEDLDNEVAGLLQAVLQSERGKGYRPPGSQLADRARQQLLRAVGRDAKPSALPQEKRDEEARKSVLAAFPDRVGRIRAVGKTLSRNRSGESVEVVLCGGGSARLLNPHLPTGIEFVVALDAEERSQGGLKGDVRLRLVGAVEPDWLLDIEPAGVQEGIEAVWNDRLEKVEVRSRLMYEKLVISDAAPSAQLGPAEQKAAEQLLKQKCMAAGLEAFIDKDQLAEWTQRLAFAREHLPKLEFPEFGQVFLETFFESLCEGRIRFQEIRDAQPFEYLKLALTQEQRSALDKMAPSSLPLPGGRRLAIHYETGKPPWVSSRMQDFFGMRDSPKLAGGAVPVVLHLLAPNQRAVQVTADLSGFWQREYPAIRKELGRRYPRHFWPEDPFTAEPPPPRPPRPPRK
nr:ATP-dependent helicase HrpB [Burkholderiales bacterium]